MADGAGHDNTRAPSEEQEGQEVGADLTEVGVVKVVLEVAEACALPGKPLQVSIAVRNPGGGGHGYRIAGPKYGGSDSRVLRTIEIDAHAARQIRGYIDLALDTATSPKSPPPSNPHAPDGGGV